MNARQPEQCAAARPPGQVPQEPPPSSIGPPDDESLKLFRRVQALLAPFGVPNVQFIAPCRAGLIQPMFWEAHPARTKSPPRAARKRLDDPDEILEHVGPQLMELLRPLCMPFGRIVIDVQDNQVRSLRVERSIQPGESLPPVVQPAR